MTGSLEERNKAIVRNAFEALFNQRDFVLAVPDAQPDSRHRVGELAARSRLVPAAAATAIAARALVQRHELTSAVSVEPQTKHPRTVCQSPSV
jgi:hypothetical protein